MKKLLHSIANPVHYAALFLLFASPALCFTNKSFFLTRPQGVDAARELVGWQTLINRSNQCAFNGAFYIAPTYIRSTQPEEIAQFLLSSLPLVFSGSRRPDRGANDLLADYFGMPSDYLSVMCFEPRIRSFIMDLDFYFGLDGITPGLYARVHMPITNTVWDMNMIENVKVPGVNPYPAGYMSSKNIPRSSLASDLSAYFRGQSTFGDMMEPLLYGQIFEREFMTRIADLSFVFGWNSTGPDYHAGVNFRAVIPTGNRPTGQFLFEAIAGNGKHAELGIGLTGHYDVWTSCDEKNKFVVYSDCNITHLLNTTVKRSYDLKKNGPGSRYMLLEQILPPSTNLCVGNPCGAMPDPGTAAANQYRQRLLPAINVTTLDTIISIDVQADLAIKFTYQRLGLGVDIGYDLYARSAERFGCRTKFEDNRYAVKGDAQIYGFGPNPINTPVPLNATQSQATLQAGQGNGNLNFTNENADSPALAFNNNSLLFQLTAADAAAFGVAQAQVNTSNPAILLTDSDIDTDAALLPRAITQSIFFHLGHVWKHGDEDRWDPFLGIGAKVEWVAPRRCATDNSGNSAWAIWAKGGVGF